MNWTNKKPTKPGWYWHRFTPDNEVRVIRLFDGLLGKIWQEGVYDDTEAPYEYFTGQFAGPIPEPEHTEWQPIETAPKDRDGEILILFDSASVEVVRLCWWNDGSLEQNGGEADPESVGWWSYKHSVTQEQIDHMTPIAWMPMPDYKK